jgi:hypothetical protein
LIAIFVVFFKSSRPTKEQSQSLTLPDQSSTQIGKNPQQKKLEKTKSLQTKPPNH